MTPNKQIIYMGILALSCLIGACEAIQMPGPGPDKTFIKYYGDFLDQEAAEVVAAIDGGFLLLGTISQLQSDGSIDKNMYVVKTGLNGNEKWSRTYGLDHVDELSSSIDIASSSNTYIIGATAVDSFGNADPYLLMIDPAGEPLWQKNVPNLAGNTDSLYETLEDVIFTQDGGILLAGNIRPIRLGDERLGSDELNKRFDTYLMKLNADGSAHPDWNNYRIWGYPEQDDLSKVKEFSMNAYSVMGTTHHDEAEQASTNILFYTSNREGIPRHAQSIGSLNREVGKDMVQHSDGQISIIGSQFTSANESSIFIAPLGPSFRLADTPWTVPNTAEATREEGQSIQFLENSNEYIVAGSSGPPGSSNIYLLKAGFDQDAFLSNSFALNGRSFPANVLELEDGFLIGASVSFGLTKVMCLIKIDEELQLNSK